MSRGARSRGRGFIVQPMKYNLRSAPDIQEDSSGQVGSNNMAHSFESRDDPEYLRSMEDELLKSRQAREEETKLLTSLASRLDRLELKPATVGRGILRTPVKSDPPQPGVGLRSPSLCLGRSAADMRSAALGVAEPAPADILNGPLTSVLQQLSIAIDPTPQASTKGLLLRPEYYVQHKDKGVSVKNLDHSKLSFKELMSGMGRVMSHLYKSGGDVASYIEHFNFLVRQAGVHSFVDTAYVGYDRYVIDKYISGESQSFVAGNLMGVALHFHAGNIPMVRSPNIPFCRGRGRGFRRGARQSWYDQDREMDKDHQQPPTMDGFPDDICFNYNYRSCTGSCKKSHICRLCRGAHKANSGQCASSKK